MSTPEPTQVQPAKPTTPEQLEAFDAARTLDRGQFRRYLQALEAQSAVQRGEPPPSALGRLFKPAETERKLVLFTLAGIVATIIIVVFIIEMWDEGSSTITATLVTLAGTGLGFIGGMVSEGKRTPSRDQQQQTDRTTTRSTTTRERTTTKSGIGADEDLEVSDATDHAAPLTESSVLGEAAGTVRAGALAGQPPVLTGALDDAAGAATEPDDGDTLPPSDVQAS